MGFEAKGQTGHKKVLTAQYLDIPLLDGHQILYTVVRCNHLITHTDHSIP
jgi:hypothetical protein